MQTCLSNHFETLYYVSLTLLVLYIYLMLCIVRSDHIFLELIVRAQAACPYDIFVMSNQDKDCTRIKPPIEREEQRMVLC